MKAITTALVLIIGIFMIAAPSILADPVGATSYRSGNGPERGHADSRPSQPVLDSEGGRANTEGQGVPQPIPEPATILLMGAGLAGAGLYRRFKKQ
ncbi:MAG: PEP-CTERM sorting domain-containing protein [candidate division Zixibacteria bacterium]|nr:PEP-CTERM sorting domain-containing protein [candidate division Zixibacteria bacterium]